MAAIRLKRGAPITGREDMDCKIYCFMFPLAIGVTITASLCGIGGPALFASIFIILLPLLGLEYLLQSAVAAFGSALIMQCFGFTTAFSVTIGAGCLISRPRSRLPSLECHRIAACRMRQLA
jgi:hypothetical protein